MVENLNFRFGLNFWFTVSSCIISCIISMDDESAFGFLTSQNHTFIEMSTDRHQIPRPVSNDLSHKTRPAPTTATLIYQQKMSLVTDSTVKMQQNSSLILNHFVLYKTWQKTNRLLLHFTCIWRDRLSCGLPPDTLATKFPGRSYRKHSRIAIFPKELVIHQS